MQYYRIMSEHYHRDPYSCSSTSSGRWHARGSRMIYAANTTALAMLEYLTIKGPAVAATRWHLVTFEVEDDFKIASLDAKALPEGWNAIPHGNLTQDFGKLWLRKSNEPLLKVPSVRIPLSQYPQEHNLLINPDFKDLKDVLKHRSTEPFKYLLGVG